MNDVVRLPARLRLVSDGIPEQLQRDKPRLVAFWRARRALHQAWLPLVGSGELTDAELQEETGLTDVVLRQILQLHRPGWPVNPDEPPPSAA